MPNKKPKFQKYEIEEGVGRSQNEELKIKAILLFLRDIKYTTLKHPNFTKIEF